ACLWWLIGGGVVVTIWAWRSGRTLPVLLALAVSFAALQLAALRSSRHHPLYIALEQRSGGLVTLTGRIETPLRGDYPGSKPGSFWFRASEIVAPQLGLKFKGRTYIRLRTEEQVHLKPGEYRIRGFLKLARTPDNSGQFDGRAFDVRLGIAADCTARDIHF